MHCLLACVYVVATLWSFSHVKSRLDYGNTILADQLAVSLAGLLTGLINRLQSVLLQLGQLLVFVAQPTSVTDCPASYSACETRAKQV